MSRDPDVDPPRSTLDRLAWPVSLLLLAGFALQAALGIQGESLTYDEPTAIGSSYLAFRTGDLRIVQDRPPLLGLFTTPLLTRLVDPPLPRVPDPRDPTSDVVFGDALLHGPGADTLRILHVARYTVLALTTALGLAVVAWARALGGGGAAMLAAFLFATSPNLLAHGRLASGDTLCAIFSFLAVAGTGWFLRWPSHARATVAGLAIGLALGSKPTALFVLPTCAVAVVLARLRGDPTGYHRGPRWGELVIVVASALIAVGLSMGGRFDYGTWLAAFGKIYQIGRPGEYAFYLAGEFYTEPRWYYYLAVAALKTPLPFLLLFTAGTATTLRWWRSEIDTWLLLLPILTLLAASFFDIANLGLRRILPIWPFAIVLAAQLIRAPLPGLPKDLAVAALCIAQAIGVFATAPHHLSYFNALAGGPDRGIEWLDDSNLDWGQDLPALRTWLRENPGPPPRLRYFGVARTATYHFDLPEMTAPEVCDPRPTRYAVSATSLVRFALLSKRIGRDCTWLGRYEPVGRAGYSIWLYDFRE